MISVKRKVAGGVFLALLTALASAFTVYAQVGFWELSDNNKYWMYLYSGGGQAIDEWIEDDGKVYYLDSKGYMKTGWVTNKDDNRKYYMGPDGAMWFNTFAPDGKYVGPDGAGVEKYDKYRKAVRAQLKKSAPKKSKTSKKGAAATEPLQQFFLLTDLNMDGYKDLIVMAGTNEAESLREISVWIPSEEKFQLAAEFDEPEKGDYSALYLDPQGEEVWLEMTEKSGEMRLFQMKYGRYAFENQWSFTMDINEAGEGCYYINDIPEDRETWELSQLQTKSQRCTSPISGYQPATEENIKAQTDQVLTEQEIELWESWEQKS